MNEPSADEYVITKSNFKKTYMGKEGYDKGRTVIPSGRKVSCDQRVTSQQERLHSVKKQ